MQRYNSYTYEYVRDFINSTGCELISQKYENCDTKLEIKCRSCNKKFETTFFQFKNSKHKCCKKCASNINTTANQYNKVKEYIESFGCKLLSKIYKNNVTPLEIECNCGNKIITDYRGFKNLKYKMCDECKRKTLYHSREYNYDTIKKYIEENSNCKLLTIDKDIDFHTNITLKCDCGNEFITTFSCFKFKNKDKCDECKGFTKWDISKIKQYVKENSNCELLSIEYINIDSNLVFKCNCGNEFETSFDKFKTRNKRQCNECSVRSNIEKFCRDYFKEHNIPYEAEKTFPDCRYPKTNGVPRYDFYIEYNNRKILIEGNGIQHEQPIRFYNAISQEEAEEKFIQQQIKDEYKKQYALNNGYEFVVIWYYDMDNIPQILDNLLSPTP